MNNERSKTFAMKGTVKHDDKIMVWGCSQQMGSVICTWLMVLWSRNSTNRSFETISSPLLNACSVEKTILFNMRHLGLDPEEWPSQSPDLNAPYLLDWTLKDRQVTNKAELWTALQEGWQALPVDLLTRLIDSMPRRLQAVMLLIRTKKLPEGYPTKY